ncbi:hypothetical protein [Halosegnis sp.]|uniref:hypothetical protein n=1 Tax=Halosegnis sp. TaxID=2864959 RepID=UPI0035D4587D
MALRRDAALALVTLTLLIAISIQAGLAARLFAPLPALVGVGGALTLELVLLANPERTQAVWERQSVRIGSIALVVGLGLLAVRTGTGAVILGALAWGLVGYLGLVAVVVASGENPLARIVE